MIISIFVGLIDDNKTKVMERSEEGGARSDNNERLVLILEDLGPNFAALGHGLSGMEEKNTFAESLFKNLDELASEGDFGDEKDSGSMLACGTGCKFEVDVSFAATSDATKEFGLTGRDF